jgi:uncharacterized protein with von Willebrand factor type A (vWA) domain
VQGAAFASLAPGQAVDASWFPDLPAWTAAVPRQLAFQRTRPGGRKGLRPGPAAIDLRRTLRWWARTGRIGIAPHWRPRPRRLGRLSVLWDVSGSMSDFLDLYLPWLWTLIRRQPDTRVYAFGTRVTDVTPWLLLPYAACRQELGFAQAVWKSGTDIGRCLADWLAGDGVRRLGSSACVVIVSDGWDAGSPDQLGEAMRALRTRAGTVIWLHPWYSSPGFEPKTRALRAALPYLDALLDGGTPEALCTLHAPRGGYRFRPHDGRPAAARQSNGKEGRP